MGHCKDCQSWDAYDAERTMGACTLLDTSRPARRYPPPRMGGEPSGNAARMYIGATWDEVKTSEYDMLAEYDDEISAALQTGPDFGCVLFEAKE